MCTRTVRQHELLDRAGVFRTGYDSRQPPNTVQGQLVLHVAHNTPVAVTASGAYGDAQLRMAPSLEYITARLGNAVLQDAAERRLGVVTHLMTRSYPESYGRRRHEVHGYAIPLLNHPEADE